jgi:hypothetical protein
VVPGMSHAQCEQGERPAIGCYGSLRARTGEGRLPANREGDPLVRLRGLLSAPVHGKPVIAK